MYIEKPHVGKLARPVYFVGGGMTDFRKRHEMKAEELIMQAARMAVLENDLLVDGVLSFKKMVDFGVGGQFADHFSDQLLFIAKAHDGLGLEPVGNIEVKTGGATGGSAVMTAVMAVASGLHDVVVVVGCEMMDEVSTRQGNNYIAHASCKEFEWRHGRSYTNLYNLMAQDYIHSQKEMGVDPAVVRSALSKVAIKNHHYARSNPFAQAPAEYTEEDIVNSMAVTEPLHILDCCLMSTGAAVCIIASEEAASKLTATPILIDGVGAGSDTLRTGDRLPRTVPLLPNETEGMYKHLTNYPGFRAFYSARYAAYIAYNMAGITDPLKDFDLAETHDAFTISALQSYEDLGFRPYGLGKDFILSGDAYLGGKLPENLSGGLIGNMHAVGATGIMQIIETGWQLQGKWAKFHKNPEIWERFEKTMPEDIEDLQVPDAKRAVAVSHAGTASHVVVHTLRRPT
ncbi:thiolase domain-containing protein [Candidatus Giovannonibacteria bacterium]|nr:thiolase domain-containing protein [Candidatus Giovannonibacteria bacterium]